MCASEKKIGEEIPTPSFQTSSQTAKLRERVGEYAILSAPLSFFIPEVWCKTVDEQVPEFVVAVGRWFFEVRFASQLWLEGENPPASSGCAVGVALPLFESG